MPDGERTAPEKREIAGPVAWFSAFAVHVLTAAGAALGLLALLAAVAHDWALMFAWLGVALIVDGIDGTFARALRVAQRLPRWSGDTLDFVVDFTTYVFVPAYALVAGDLMPAPLALPAGVVIVVTSAIYFADRDMKMADNCFRGFPALWNVAAFYLFLVRPDPWIALGAVAVLAVLTFAPLPFVHPLRVARLRVLSVVLLIAWGVLAALAIAQNLAPGLWVTAALCAIALYFFAIGALRRPT
jgi:phosphatidylcholine synthase